MLILYRAGSVTAVLRKCYSSVYRLQAASGDLMSLWITDHQKSKILFLSISIS